VTEFSLLLPTRDRPQLARQALTSVLETADRPDRLEVILYVDEDDGPSQDITCAGLKVVKLIRPRDRMGAITQACYAAATGRYVMLWNDDVVCRSRGWDTEIQTRLQAYADGVALVWGNDLFRGDTLPSHPIMPRTTCELMGGVCPRQYHRDYIDTHLYDIFCTLRQLGHDRLIYLPHVLFEHRHFEVGKSDFDSTYKKCRKADDELVWIAWAEERYLAASRLARQIETAAADGNTLRTWSSHRTGLLSRLRGMVKPAA
jgi:hypothetical protein